MMAGVRPTRAGGRITAAEHEKIAAAVEQVLNKSIALGGTTFRDYVDVDETPGLHQLHLMVYDREAEACRACKTRVRRVVQAGRSSFFCPSCQR